MACAKLTEIQVIQYKYQRVFNNVLSQVISPSGEYLFAGNIFGDIFIIQLKSLDQSHEGPRSVNIHSLNREILSLRFYQDHLIVGTTGNISGFKWDEENAELSVAPTWSFTVPVPKDSFRTLDVNDMWLQRNNNMLFAAVGDNVHQIDLEVIRKVRDYEGHTDFIHAICGTENNLYTVSEDGSMRHWSPLNEGAIKIFEPYKNQRCDRPEFGKWLGAVAVSDDWLLCGGGTKLSIWSNRSQDLFQTFDFAGKVHVTDFVDSNILVAGECKNLQMYRSNGALKLDVEVTLPSINSVAWQDCPIKILTAAGFSNNLHVIRSCRYLDKVVELYEPYENEVQIRAYSPKQNVKQSRSMHSIAEDNEDDQEEDSNCSHSPDCDSATDGLFDKDSLNHNDFDEDNDVEMLDVNVGLSQDKQLHQPTNAIQTDDEDTKNSADQIKHEHQDAMEIDNKVQEIDDKDADMDEKMAIVERHKEDQADIPVQCDVAANVGAQEKTLDKNADDDLNTDVINMSVAENEKQTETSSSEAVEVLPDNIEQKSSNDTLKTAESANDQPCETGTEN